MMKRVCVARITEYLKSILKAAESGRMWTARNKKCNVKSKRLEEKSLTKKEEVDIRATRGCRLWKPLRPCCGGKSKQV